MNQGLKWIVLILILIPTALSFYLSWQLRRETCVVIGIPQVLQAAIGPECP